MQQIRENIQAIKALLPLDRRALSPQQRELLPRTKLALAEVLSTLEEATSKSQLVLARQAVLVRKDITQIIAAEKQLSKRHQIYPSYLQTIPRSYSKKCQPPVVKVGAEVAYDHRLGTIEGAAPVLLTIELEETAKLLYTRDGSMPMIVGYDQSGVLLKQGLFGSQQMRIEEDTVLKMLAFRGGCQPSPVVELRVRMTDGRRGRQELAMTQPRHFIENSVAEDSVAQWDEMFESSPSPRQRHLHP